MGSGGEDSNDGKKKKVIYTNTRSGKSVPGVCG